MKFHHILFLITLFYISCDDSSKKKVSELNAKITQYNTEFKSKKVDFDPTMRRLGDYPNSNKDFKIVVWHNGDCDLCYSKLKKWKLLVSDFNKVNNNISYDFIVSGEHTNHIEKSLSKIEFPRELAVLDSMETFIQKNEFLNHPAFNSMILDKDDKIIFIGSPLNSESLKNHYINIINNSL